MPDRSKLYDNPRSIDAETEAIRERNRKRDEIHPKGKPGEVRKIDGKDHKYIGRLGETDPKKDHWEKSTKTDDGGFDVWQPVPDEDKPTS